jgi:hypothetical protein
MSLRHAARRGVQRPRLQVLPSRRVGSAGPDAVEFAASKGLILDDWQAWVVDGLLSEDAEARLVASMAVLLVPRQNGKNSILECVELYALYVLDLPLILHTAHLQVTSADHMMRMRSLIESDPDLAAITEFHLANGKERIVRSDTGGQIKFVTRSKKTGRGGSPQLVVFDEALYLSDEAMQALVPSLSAQSMRDDAPLMVFTSSAPVGESEVLHRLRDACLRGGVPDAFFAEWSCEPGVDPDDRDAWFDANPGMGIRIDPDWVASNERAVLKPEAFLTERLGVVFGVDDVAVELPGWHDCLDADSQIAGTFSTALDVSDDGAFCSIAVAGVRADRLLHVELVSRFEGTMAVVPALLKMGVREVLLDPRASAAGLISDLGAAGVRVREVGILEYVRACAGLKRKVANGGLRHRGQADLNMAVQHAAVRTVGEAWVWARRSSKVDISPIVAVTLAASCDPVDLEQQVW